MNTPFAPSRARGRLGCGRPQALLTSIAALVFSCGLLLHVPAAAAATLAEDMAQVTKDACISVAKKRGYSVEEVTSAQPSSGDSSSVVLRLAKGGERFEFNCGFSQNIRQFVEPVPESKAVAQRDDRVATDPRVNVNRNRDRDAVQQRERVVVQQRDRVRDRDRVETTERRRGFNPLWLLPLLLLPLLFFFLRPRQEADVSAVKAGSYASPSKPTVAVSTTTTPKAPPATAEIKVLEAVLRAMDAGIEVRSGAGVTNDVIRTLESGSTVKLNGRYVHDWAELADGGWIDIKALVNDPRV
jgi:hypothetical protein